MRFKLVEDVSTIQIPDKLYHATYKQFLTSIQQKGLGNTRRKMWTDSMAGVVYLADDPWVAESYAEEAEWLDRIEDPDKYLDNIIILEIDSNKLDKSKLSIDGNVQLDIDEKNSTWEYHGIIPWSSCSLYSGSSIGEGCLNEASIDPEGKYTDYGTGKVTGDDIFDDRTHVPFYDQLFTNPEQMVKDENLKGHIEMMSPREYFEICATKIFENSSVESLKRSRAGDPRVLDEIREIIVKYKRQVFLPYLNYAERNQEGLHRMLVAAELFGWDHKFPVLIIEWADEQLAFNRALEKERNRIRGYIKNAVQDTLRYTFNDISEFDEEVKSQVDYKFDFIDEKVTQFKVTHNSDETTDVEVNDVVYQFDTELIKIEPSIETDDDEIDLDDIDLDDLDIDLDDLDMDEFLRKYGIG